MAGVRCVCYPRRHKMLHRIRSRSGLSGLDALLEGDVLFFRSGDGGDGDGAGGSGGGGGGSSDEDDEDGDDGDTGSAGGDGDDGSDDDDEEAERDARVRKANKQAKKLRLQLKEANAELAKLKGGSGASDSEKEQAEQAMAEARQRAERAEQKLIRIERENVITKVATDLKFADPDTIVAMAETGRIDDLDPEDPDSWDRSDVKDALKALAKKKPHLLGTDSSNNGDDRGRRGGTNPPGRRDRSDEEIDKLPVGQRATARLTRAFASKK
jgi:hypothetical protein